MVRDAEDSRASRLLEFYTAHAGVLLLPDPPLHRPQWQAWRMGVPHIAHVAGFQVGHVSHRELCGVLELYLPGPTWGTHPNYTRGHPSKLHTPCRRHQHAR